MTVEQLIAKWEQAKRDNVAAATRLRDAGQRELALEALRENRLVDAFVADLKQHREEDKLQ